MNSTTPVAVMSAMPEELAVLLEALDGESRVTAAGVNMHRGSIDGVPVLLAVSGVGKVNAAAVAQTLLLQGATALIFTGVAGSASTDLAVGDLVVSRDAIQHDVDVTALGYERALVPGEPLAWPADRRLVELALRAAGQLEGVQAVEGRVATGDVFVADALAVKRLRDELGAHCVEMEGAAAAQVCHRAGVPFVIIRSISDSADGDAQSSFREFTEMAAQRSKQVVRRMLADMRPAA